MKKERGQANNAFVVFHTGILTLGVGIGVHHYLDGMQLISADPPVEDFFHTRLGVEEPGITLANDGD